MKVGIFADVHGNIYAFEKIWKALQRESCDFYCFLGDICGYYYHQNEVIEIIKNVQNIICVKGNHDDIFIKMLKEEISEETCIEKYGKSYSVMKENIRPDNLNFIKSLPSNHVIDDHNIALFHGSPWKELNGYIYPDTLLERFRQLTYKFVLLGHTHYAMDRKMQDVRIINPGSCGQPRDYNQPSYAVLYTESEKVTIKRVEYNTDAMIKDIIDHKEENLYLSSVLQREKSKYA
jgi:putative phosphoesterase